MRSGDPWASSDPLGEALHFLRMSGSFYCRSELTPPWGLDLPPEPGSMWFHVVNAGRCWLDVDGDEPRQLQPGDFALVPHGEGHRLYSEPGTPTPRFDELEYDCGTERYAILRHDGGGGGTPTSLVCGTVRFGHPAARSLMALLPDAVIIDGASRSPSPEAEWMHSTLRLIAAEGRQLRPGGEAVITRLSDILVIQAIRAWIADHPAGHVGWLRALQDPRIGRAMSLVHRDPAKPWSVAALARETAMSRSAFAARFTELVGEPVMHYVTRWRMQVALDRLQQGDSSVGELAAHLGYESEAAFKRAFKRTVGITPGSVRRTPPEELLTSAADAGA
ncbi:transcriptional regulator, AraC family [Beutenbergia cavernae DSM 12333]|uniref:Transcriptional regulator, AraC family n=1 Tax=Beutenbergia cavernae (strain ATCC BAA-8 / DSM 12333 / CCUG 43141 / JCM 11478 / NBRC 16432 / NCIMB 13614 / HKI 0122) TaxID=471853 RepID=C5C4U4_BEUC1|nr:AraC family transcriptional regulator [Beutenbergia cavernae]ACQ80072.1 transcriptional regulator, AraC family [Beutenbergia cavernae DSM 12333]